MNYTLMNMEDNRVVDFRVVETADVGGKSTNMEKLGCREALNSVVQQGLNVVMLATD